MADYGRSTRATASSPGPAPQAMASDQTPEHVSVRPMRLKVLYTFDSENKTNCLARWPQPLDIQTAFLEENTQIGVIELKTCIQAIAAASPELVAKLSHDFTVYAYDYSEYETPLVGQGMLSWILASSSSTPGAPAHQSRTMVTGRVCKNVLGVFSNTSQETLEVKLRLVPVPTSLQSEYVDSMQKYRNVSQMMPPGFDPQVWTSFLKANPNFMQQAMQSRSESPAVGLGQQGGYGIEHVQRLLSGDQSQKAIGGGRQPMSRSNSFANIEPVQQLPRMPSPALSVQSTASVPKRRGKKPGPKGPRGGRAASKKQEPVPESNDTGYGSTDDRFVEDGPARKRAKVMQAEWSGKQDFAKQPDSLRVAASSAASVRIHQPTAVRPGASLANSLEGPPREPTPIGNPMQKSGGRLLPTGKSRLRESLATEKKTYASPYPPTDATKPSESAVTSPENSRIGSSPPDMGSSPPVYGDSTGPCSPNLPEVPLSNFEDSGFMSGSIDDLFEDDELPPLGDDDFEPFAQYGHTPSLPVLPPTQQKDHQLSENKYIPQPQSSAGTAIAKSWAKARNAAGSRILSRTASSGNLPDPSIPASDPVRPTTLNRCQTWSGHQAPHPASDIAPLPPIMDSIERPASRNRRQSETGTGSGVKRKAAIQSKLATSIAAGEMPPFCENCGSIETPTWRKAWVKIHSGTPEHVRISEEEGGIIAWQTLQTDHSGTVCLYRIIKKSILKTDQGFTEILLCNPCGLYLHTRKCMRPRSAWDRSHKGPDDTGSKGPPSKRPRGGSVSNGSRKNRSRSTAIYSDRSSPANDRGGQTETTEADPQLPIMKMPRASSVERTATEGRPSHMDDASAVAALQHAIQSSPHKFRGTQDVPIDVESLTPQPTRRLLFPSPPKSQEARPKGNSVSGSGSNAKNSPFDASKEDPPQADKENRPPTTENQSSNEQLDPNHPSARSATPEPSTPSKAHLFKTPNRTLNRTGPPPTTGDFFSSAAKALLRPTTMTPKRTPTRGQTANSVQPLEELSPFTAHLNQLLYDTNTKNSNGSPEGSTHHNFDFPSLPSLRNTPGRAGSGSRTLDFDFSAFDSQDLISTDVPMPSSPPAWFGVYEDSDVNLDFDVDVDDGGGRSLWGNETLPPMMGSSPMKARTPAASAAANMVTPAVMPISPSKEAPLSGRSGRSLGSGASVSGAGERMERSASGGGGLVVDAHGRASVDLGGLA